MTIAVLFPVVLDLVRSLPLVPTISVVVALVRSRR
jgi:hypothetical protein